MGKFIPVEPEKWAEMVKAMGVVKELNADINRLRDRHGELCAENARLKAECQARQAENSVLAVECDSLKAEVERLTQLNSTLALRYDATNSMLDGCAKTIEEMEAQVERLTSDLQMEKENEDRLVRLHQDARNEVERLTKAGDNMYSWLGVCGRHNNSTGDDWLRAKKGLPSLSEQWEIEKRNRAAEDAAKKGGQS
jgi:chromosome segregation ATPase